MLSEKAKKEKQFTCMYVCEHSRMFLSGGLLEVGRSQTWYKKEHNSMSLVTVGELARY